ncbi:hypothetical protein [Halobacterium zhouii]|uniref:hypothetical protein n=1 Tax=Halobacterium zhouii TaxID=2902624 RepID=UPI001E59C361|nr:hypothetical protein [Halobacterium zhouii]
MRRNTFVKLSAVLFGLVFVSFVVLGFSRLVLPYRTARLLAAPTLFAASVLAVVLLGQAVLSVVGVSEIE